MDTTHILQNLLFFFLPLALSSTFALLGSKKIRAKRKIIIWGNSILFVIVIIYSVMASPAKEALQVEWTFYGLNEESVGSYKMHSLLGEGAPSFLDLESEPGKVEGIPDVHSGEHAQMRFNINRKGYVYVFHFDTTFNTFKRLFPSDNIQQSNPVQPDYWIEIPTGDETWRFNLEPGLEVFLCYISLTESKDIEETIRKIINDAKISSSDNTGILDSLQKQLKALALVNFISSGEYEHNLAGIVPEKVKTNIYQARNKQSALILQFIRHK